MTLTKKHFIGLAKICASIQEVSDNKENKQYEALAHHAIYEIRHFCINHGKNFDGNKFDTFVFMELQRRRDQKEKRRIKRHERALEVLHNSQFGMPKQ